MHKRLAITITLLCIGLISLTAINRISSIQAAQTTPKTQSWSCLSNGQWGMMTDWDHMNPGMMGPDMMNGSSGMISGMWGMMGNAGMMGFYPATAIPISLDDAQVRATAFAAECGDGVEVTGLVAFGGGYYAQLFDSSGAGLGEVLVDRYTGVVYPEPGPSMMWNSQWGYQAGTGGVATYDRSRSTAISYHIPCGLFPGCDPTRGADVSRLLHICLWIEPDNWDAER